MQKRLKQETRKMYDTRLSIVDSDTANLSSAVGIDYSISSRKR
jgi:hypothetical protein